MRRATLTRLPERPPERVRQPQPLRRQRQQRGARPRRKPGAVRPDFYLLAAGTSHHLQGAPPERERRVSTTTTLPAQADVSAHRRRQRRPRYRRIEARRRSTAVLRRFSGSGRSYVCESSFARRPAWIKTARLSSATSACSGCARPKPRKRAVGSRVRCWPISWKTSSRSRAALPQRAVWARAALTSTAVSALSGKLSP